ncbi:pyridoxine biosynthesis protein, partial [Coemansia thaxteri]
MPALSPTMTEGGIARWEKKEGEAFSAGDLLLQIETDKAQMDVEAQDDGVLVKILAPEGTQNVAVNSPIAIIAEEGDDVSSIDVAGLLASNPASTKADSGNAPATPAPASKAAVAEPASPAVVSQHLSGDTSAHGLLSPAVTFAIHANHIANAGEIAGSGPKGRILKGDVIQFLKDGKAIISKDAP